MNDEFTINTTGATAAQQVTESVNFTPPPGQVGAERIKEDNFRYADFKAGAAIGGLPRGELADKLEFLEKEWNDWTADHSEEFVTYPIEPFRILRLQIRELALGYATASANNRALEIHADIGKAHIQDQRKHAEFRRFIAQHFETDLENGVGRGLTIFEMAQDIMLRANPRWFEFWRW